MAELQLPKLIARVRFPSSAPHSRPGRQCTRRADGLFFRTRRARVAELGGRAVGIALAGPSLGDESPRELQLYVIYVLAEAHGTGIGQELLEAVLGDEPAQLWVAEDNPRAIAFYSRNGFHPDGATQTADRGVTGFPPLTEIRLVRPGA